MNRFEGIGKIVGKPFYKAEEKYILGKATLLIPKKDKKGDTSFSITLTGWGDNAELFQNMNAGDNVHVVGELGIEKWLDKKTNANKEAFAVTISSIKLEGDEQGEYDPITGEIEDEPF